MRDLRALLIFAAMLLTTGVSALAAPKTPVQWHVKAAPNKPVKVGSKFNVTITGEPEPGWHLYALEEPEGGPIATEISLTDGDPADLLRVEESKPKMLPDPITQKPAGFFDGAADFVLHLQSAKDAAMGAGALRVMVRYQSCNDHVCLPPHTETVTVPVTIAR
jgi:hypothetical protein